MTVPPDPPQNCGGQTPHLFPQRMRVLGRGIAWSGWNCAQAPVAPGSEEGLGSQGSSLSLGSQQGPFPDRVSVDATEQHVTLADSASLGHYFAAVFAGLPQRRCFTQSQLHAHRADDLVQAAPLVWTVLCGLSPSVLSSPLGVFSPSLLTICTCYIYSHFHVNSYSHACDSILKVI